MPRPTVLVLLAEGFEEMEFVTPVDVLRRAGAEVTTSALVAMHVTGRSGLTLHAESVLSAVEASDFDCVLLPGGAGVTHLRADPRVRQRVQRQESRGGWIAAICAAPLVLKDAGLLEGRRFTAHFTVAGELPGALLDERVVVDGRLITSRGAGTALEFGLTVVRHLFSVARQEEIARSISA